MSKGKKLKKLVKGGLVEYQQPITTGAGILGGLIDSTSPEGSVFGGTASGALKGAAGLSALGPAGMIAGAIGGGTMGLINARKAKTELEAQQEQKGLLINRQLMQNAGNSFKEGGKLASKLKVQSGGNLESVSTDAVEVKANNPNQTDSVELQNAFVDNNEVIDKNNRVFSDSIFLNNGKSIAKEAKRLEKMKSEKARFNDANSHIESKLDGLFQYQEKQKQIPEGKLRGRFDGENPFDYVEGNFNQLNYRGEELKDQLENMKKKKLDTGGLISTPLGQIKKPVFKPFTPNQPIEDVTKESFDFSKLSTGLATFGPNLASGLLQKKLKGPASPQLESSLRLKSISADPQLAEATRQFGSAQQVVNKNTAQGADLVSSTGMLLAKKLNAQNQIYGQVNQSNIDINNREALINQGIKARNAERITNFSNDQNDFSNKKKQLTSENIANLGQKVLMQGKERNQIDKDIFALDVLGKGYEDSGVLRRDTGKTISDYVKKKGFKPGNKMGGRLKGIKC